MRCEFWQFVLFRCRRNNEAPAGHGQVIIGGHRSSVRNHVGHARIHTVPPMLALKRTLLVVCPEGRKLRLFTCVSGIAGWSQGRAEVLDYPAGEIRPDAIAAAVRPIMLRWGVPPGSEVAIVFPVVAGGVLSVPLVEGTPGQGWLERQLRGRLPFGPGDINYFAQRIGRAQPRELQVTWLPQSIAGELRAAFARLGLLMGEIVFRPQLLAMSRHVQGKPGTELVLERMENNVFSYATCGGVVLSASQSEVRSAAETVDRAQLDRIAVEAAGKKLARIVVAGPEQRFDGALVAALGEAWKDVPVERQFVDLPAMFLAFWRRGGKGIWLAPEDPAPIAKAWRLGYAVAATGCLLAAGMTWHAGMLREEIASLELRESRLRPQYQAVVEKERQASAYAGAEEFVADLARAPGDAQAVLLAVFNALPRNAWLTDYAFERLTTTVSGRGIDSRSMIGRLAGQAGVADAVAVEDSGPTGASGGAAPQFRVRFQWKPISAEKPK